MSCKSALYTANTSSSVVEVGSAIPFGSIVRRFGNNINLNGSGINITGSGYYDTDISVTATPSAAGTVTVTLYKDGVAVPGATASATVGATSITVNLSIKSLIRLQCCNTSSTLSLVLSGAESTVSNVASVVEKI